MNRPRWTLWIGLIPFILAWLYAIAALSKPRGIRWVTLGLLLLTSLAAILALGHIAAAPLAAAPLFDRGPNQAAFSSDTVAIPDTATVRGLTDRTSVTALSARNWQSGQVTGITQVPIERIYLPLIVNATDGGRRG